MPAAWCVYILSNHAHTTYVGSTNDLLRRLREHENKTYAGAFTARWTFNRLVYYEFLPHETAARAREMQIKKWRREKKVTLIQRENPNWADLTPDVVRLFRLN
jgi:putative endonuclease